MQKTTVYFPDDLKQALERASAASGQSEAELIRAALYAFIVAKAPPKPRLPLFESGDRTLAERVEEELSGFGTS